VNFEIRVPREGKASAKSGAQFFMLNNQMLKRGNDHGVLGKSQVNENVVDYRDKL
jgi:hypothetical protein